MIRFQCRASGDRFASSQLRSLFGIDSRQRVSWRTRRARSSCCSAAHSKLNADWYSALSAARPFATKREHHAADRAYPEAASRPPKAEVRCSGYQLLIEQPEKGETRGGHLRGCDLRVMQNIQVIDGALNAVYDIFQATDQEFSLILPAGSCAHSSTGHVPIIRIHPTAPTLSSDA